MTNDVFATSQHGRPALMCGAHGWCGVERHVHRSTCIVRPTVYALHPPLRVSLHKPQRAHLDDSLTLRTLLQ